jgi:hypothetical protein
MYIQRILATIETSLAIAAGIFASAPMASASPATASVSPTLMAAAINCSDSRVYHTVGRVTCSGTGLFRAKADCAWQEDQYSNWVRINNSTATAYVECAHKIRSVTAETRPGA